MQRAIEAGGDLYSMGEVFHLEADIKFATLASAGAYAVLTCMERGLPPVTVRHRQGEKYSHYSHANQEIALASWGGTRLTLCHELAHHEARVLHNDDTHGDVFRKVFTQMLTHCGAPEQARYLRTCWGM